MIDAILIPLAGIALPTVIVPTILAFKHSAKKREYEHLERMKALETGQPVPGESHWAAALACASVGAGVPIGSFLFTSVAALNGIHPSSNDIWMAPVIVSAFALMSSTWMAKSMFRPKRPARSPYADAPLNGKPHAMDPDAYDVAGARG